MAAANAGETTMPRHRNVFEAIANDGHDEFFAPLAGQGFMPTAAAPGSTEKIHLLRQRVVEGQPLWHDEDRRDYAGLTAIVPPRYT
jgi:hypothetical protein